ncbi:MULTISPECIES: SRPBCC family protein [unclassified Knoellia]|uniref:SRPBCC family protein n=1 Tax=Knoellia altitudinis TaxID=3404795 RepID=UPI00361A806A
MTKTHTASATGRREERDGTAYLVFERTFRAPIEDVWAAVTESDRLVRWIGHWSGDPTRGAVSFWMTAEAEDAPEETIHIDECSAPQRLVMRSARPDDHSLEWRWQLDLDESQGVTTLTFAQEVADSTLAEGVGPGWDYYLDRLVAAETGDDLDADLAAIDFDDYFPALSEHYRRELA